MNKIIVVARQGRQIGWELGDCMACLANAGVRDYTARLEGSIIFWVADRMFARAVKALRNADFEAVPEIVANVPTVRAHETHPAP